MIPSPQSVLCVLCLFGVSVSAYPGALCNVTYDIPAPCSEVLGKLADQVLKNFVKYEVNTSHVQMKLWDNTTSCPGDCEKVDFSVVHLIRTTIFIFNFQRHFLPDKRGPPLVPVTLEGTGETCKKCPCGQKCLYVHKKTTSSKVSGLHTSSASH